MAALGFEPPPLGREPDAIPLDQCVVFTIITKPNDDFVCKKIKKKKKFAEILISLFYQITK